jgi:5'-nucleotidase
VAGRILPFSMTLGIYAVKGRSIRAALEGAINNAIDNGVQGTGTGSFPYVAGLKFIYCSEQPMGQRITTLDVKTSQGWLPLDDDKIYRGISSSYTVLGKEGYAALLDREEEIIPVMVSMADAFAAYARTYPKLWPLEETLELLDSSC